MDEERFEEAVRIAEQYREQALPDAERYRTSSADRRQQVFPSLIRDSAWDWMAWDAVKLIAEQLHRRGELPRELIDWAVDVATGKRKPPKRGPGRPRKNWGRDHAMVDAVKELEAKGYQPTRNSATDPHVSACDAVAKAFRLKYGDVERVWVAFRSWEKRDVPEAMLRWVGIPRPSKSENS